ncbi:MAG: hypothetical protein EOP39_02655 [Rubrivivax sp.]|nr:MAG: hypothetical protein EOP39_02655 [Rubrivivax sp.]
MSDGVSVKGLRGAAEAGSASRMAEALLAMFEHIGGLADKVQWVHRHVTADLSGPLDASLERAGAAVAAAIDADPSRFDRHGYHNRQHFCEVALAAYGLCMLNRIDTGSTQLVLLAALAHDFIHEGSAKPGFVQERASVASLGPLLEAGGMDAAQIARLATLVLATEPIAGTAFMAAACQAHAHDTPVALAAPADAPELAALAADAELAALARLLCAADVLPSLGLGEAHALRLQDRLAVEWRRPLTRADKLAFMDGVLRLDYIDRLFRPAVEALRAALSPPPHAAPIG